MFFNQKKDAKDEYEAYMKSKKWKRVRQIGFDKINKHPIYVELTYKYFVDYLGDEWMFDCNALKKTISISVGEKYELGILDWEKDSWDIRYYETKAQLLNDEIVMGKRIRDLWEDLEN